jgi:predicted ferric reductase
MIWQVLSLVALLTLVYRYFIAPLLQASNPWSVSAVQKLSEKQCKLSLEPASGRAMDYQAGQFAWLKMERSAFSISENPFSIASSPAQGPEIYFVIKELGDFTSTLGDVCVGERAYIDGPYGSLTVDGRKEPRIALIAGGVGI